MKDLPMVSSIVKFECLSYSNREVPKKPYLSFFTESVIKIQNLPWVLNSTFSLALQFVA